MAAQTIPGIRPQRSLTVQKKRLSGVMMLLMALSILPANAQEVVLRDTTLATEVMVSAHSITAGPNVTIAGTGDVIFSAKSVAIRPEFSVVSGGKLLVISGVPPVNNASPTFTSVLVDQAIPPGELFRFTYEATDANGDELTFELVRAPGGAVIDANTGAFSWTPTANQAGQDHTIETSVTDGFNTATTSATLAVMVPVSTEEPAEGPGVFMLTAPHPNPFTSVTTVQFSTPRQRLVQVELYDVLGRRVTSIYEGMPQPGGLHTLRINGGRLPNGIYFLTFTGDGIRHTKKVIRAQ